MNKLPIHSALVRVIAEIEKRLKVEVYGVERTMKVYSVNANSFVLKTISPQGKKKYFLKFHSKKNIKGELEGVDFTKKYLSTPKPLWISSKYFGLKWILFEYVSGKLMSEKILELKSKKQEKSFINIEKQKEELLQKLHSSAEKNIDFKEYSQSRTNKLFKKRLLGARYENYYSDSKNSLSSYFDHKIILNGKRLPKTIRKTVNSIKNKYNNPTDKRIKAIRSHGDAHYGNIILGKKIWFIDNEYADYAPPYMELAKPYYNDFIGVLFFHHYKNLYMQFNLLNHTLSTNKLELQVNPIKKDNIRLEATQIKLETRRKSVNENTQDFLSLNDYLLMCHMLTRNPNHYPLKAQMLFLAFILIIADFNPFKPNSIYDYF